MTHEDLTLSTGAKTVEGILHWAFRITSSSGYISPSLEPDTAKAAPRVRLVEELGDASFVIREVNRLTPEILVQYVRAVFGHDRLSETRLTLPLCRETGQTPRTIRIAHLVIQDWSGEERGSIREISQQFGISRDRAKEISSIMRGRLGTWDEMAIQQLNTRFREKGWVK